MQLIAPSSLVPAAASAAYQQHLNTFKRAAAQLDALHDAVTPDLELTAKQVRLISEFVTWTRSHTPEEWRVGVILHFKDLYRVTGKNKFPVNLAKRACLVKIKHGSRKKGGCGTYTLSRPHLNGLLRCLVMYSAMGAASRCIELDAKYQKLEVIAKVTLTPESEV